MSFLMSNIGASYWEDSTVKGAGKVIRKRGDPGAQAGVPVPHHNNSFRKLGMQQAAVETAEGLGQHEGHGEDSGGEDEDGAGLAQVEIADAADEEIADGEVEKAPEDVDRRGGQAFAGWMGKGTLERAARDAIEEMGQAVGEEHAAEEIGDVVVPAHEGL